MSQLAALGTSPGVLVGCWLDEESSRLPCGLVQVSQLAAGRRVQLGCPGVLSWPICTDAAELPLLLHYCILDRVSQFLTYVKFSQIKIRVYCNSYIIRIINFTKLFIFQYKVLKSTETPLAVFLTS